VLHGTIREGGTGWLNKPGKEEKRERKKPFKTEDGWEP